MLNVSGLQGQVTVKGWVTCWLFLLIKFFRLLHSQISLLSLGLCLAFPASVSLHSHCDCFLGHTVHLTLWLCPINVITNESIYLLHHPLTCITKSQFISMVYKLLQLNHYMKVFIILFFKPVPMASSKVSWCHGITSFIYTSVMWVPLPFCHMQSSNISLSLMGRNLWFYLDHSAKVTRKSLPTVL